MVFLVICILIVKRAWTFNIKVILSQPFPDFHSTSPPLPFPFPPYIPDFLMLQPHPFHQSTPPTPTTTPCESRSLTSYSFAPKSPPLSALSPTTSPPFKIPSHFGHSFSLPSSVLNVAFSIQYLLPTLHY